LDPLHGKLVLAQLVGEDSEQVQGIGMIWLEGENLPVDLLGRLESPGLMVLKGDR